MGFGALPVVGSLRAGGVRLDFVSEVCTAGLGGIKETPGVVAGGWASGGLRAGISTDGGEAVVGSDCKTCGRCGDVEVVVLCEPMLRAATSVVGIGCDSTAAFFGVLEGGLGKSFPFGVVKKFKSAWRSESLRLRRREPQKIGRAHV